MIVWGYLIFLDRISGLAVVHYYSKLNGHVFVSTLSWIIVCIHVASEFDIFKIGCFFLQEWRKFMMLWSSPDWEVTNFLPQVAELYLIKNEETCVTLNYSKGHRGKNIRRLPVK